MGSGQPVFAPSSAEPKLLAQAGGARRDRTDDLMLAKHALSQLSYGPVPEDECFLSRSICSPAFASAKAQRPSFKRACRAEAAEQRRLVGLGRLELPTSRLSSARSNQLSYKPEAEPENAGPPKTAQTAPKGASKRCVQDKASRPCP
jgi:hypothetical protein